MKRIKKYLHQHEPENLTKKLAAYSAAAAGALALATGANAGVVYTRDPGAIFHSGDASKVDINHDTIIDVNLQVQYGFKDTTAGGNTSRSFYGIANALITYNQYIEGDTYTISGQHPATPFRLNPGDTVSHIKHFNQGVTNVPQYLAFDDSIVDVGTGTTLRVTSFGHWLGAPTLKRYLGVKFVDTVGAFHYGWIRMRVSAGATYDTIVQYDFAYESIADSGIIIPLNERASVATNVVGTDVANHNNGSDLQVTFNKAADERGIQQYQIFVVKTASAGTFTRALAETNSNFTSVTPTGNNITQILDTLATDADGARITNNVPYEVFILSVANGAYADDDSLSAPSASFTLTNGSVTVADMSTNIVPHDIGNNDNGTDLEVTFNHAADETTVSAYRLIVVKEANAGTFNLAAANAVTSGNYTSVTPNGNNVSQTFLSNATDADGSPIHDSVAYRVFVLNVAGGSATTNSLSEASAPITLLPAALPTVADTSTHIVATDIANNDNGSDMQVAFNKAANETTVSAYRIIVVKEANAASFNLTAANAITSGNYTSITPTGGNITHTLSSIATTSDGSLIKDSVAYRVFVLNVAGGSATTNSLSEASASITLTGPAGITQVDELQNVDLYSYADNVFIHFQNAAHTTGILQVYNSIGQQIYSNTVSGDQKIRINATEGVYVASFTQDGKTLRKLLYISNQ